MSLRFRGGESLQRGRGIGGLLRLAKSLFSPIVRSIGETAVKAAKSRAGKKIIEEVKDQAVSTGINMLADAVRGNDMKQSAKRELKAVKHRAADIIESLKPTKKEGIWHREAGLRKRYGGRLSFKCDLCCDESFSCKKLLELHNDKYKEEHKIIKKFGRPTYPWEITNTPTQAPQALPAPAQHQALPAPAIPSPLPVPSIANPIPYQPVTALQTPLPTQNLAAPAQQQTLPATVQLQHLAFHEQHKSRTVPVSVSAQRQCDHFSCHLCERTFSLKHHLERHIEGVHGYNKFKCDYCYKTFSQQENLNRHVKGGPQGISFACETCSFKTTRKDNLKRHYESEHKC